MTAPAANLPPSIVISLDFELRWGVLDRVGDDFSAYRANLEGVHEVVPRMLDVFDHRQVLSTWAIVGSMACSGWEEWHDRCPPWPDYERPSLRWRPELRGDPGDEVLYFAPELVDLVRAHGHEVGSHSFTHLYMNEPGVTTDDVRRDCAAMAALFHDRWQDTPTSFVFPRNQERYAEVLEACGLSARRANPATWYWDTARPTTPLTRVLRAADGFSPWPSRRVPARETARQRASHFVRFQLGETAWRLHRRRLQRDASRLADGEVLHLWWHPHNLGASPARSITRLGELLDVLGDAAPAARFLPMRALTAPTP